MLLYIIRHGDPTYDPDSLTPLGKRQAEALAKRLSVYGLDEIYVSPLIRAQQTAQPTCEVLKKEMHIEAWTSESLAWQDFVTHTEEKNSWVFFSRQKELRCKRMVERGSTWYEDPIFDDTNAQAGYQRILNASDEFLARLGYVHDRENCCYIPQAHNDKRVAVFCHQGFGVSWLGTLLDIPLPIAWTSFDYTFTGMTVIRFQPCRGGVVVPQVLTLSNDGHLYREGLLTGYQNAIHF